MFVELIESLRCPRPHQETVLVASATRTEARHIVDGLLGCPSCGAEFRIEAGVLRLDEETHHAASTAPSPDAAMRIGAFLGLTDARGFALLCGEWAAHADLVRRLTDTPLVLVNPPEEVPADVAAGVVLTAGALPFAAGSVRAAALSLASRGGLDRSAVTAVRAGGRVLGDASLPLPEGLTEVARDARMWVAEKNAAPDRTPRLVEIRRGSR